MSRIRFLHTADWQLGMRRHFLSEEALPRYRQARIDAIRTIGAIAEEQRCAFVVVGGDVFESNQIDSQTLRRAVKALDALPVPAYLLPANHDPLDAGTIYRPQNFKDHPNITILASNEPVEAAPGVEIVGAPWLSKRPQRDLVAEACARLQPEIGTLRILVGHGAAGVAGDHDDPAQIRLDAVEAALGDGRIHYCALGDRHSVTRLHDRIWYAGTPEPTTFRETGPGFVLVVEVDESNCKVERHAVAQWSFVEKAWALDASPDVGALASWLDAFEHKERTVLKLRLEGSLSLKAKAQLDGVLATAADDFAGLQERSERLVVVPDDLDLSDLGLGGFARSAVDELTDLAGDDTTARDALALLYRLAGGSGR